MKKYDWKKIQLLIFSSIFSLASFSQLTPDRLKQFVTDEKNNKNTGVINFYTLLNYKTAWIQKENTLNRHLFLEALKTSPSLGLKENDYPIPYIENLANGSVPLTSNDSLEAEVRITAAAIHFYKDIAYGNTRPAFGYNEINYQPDCKNIPSLLAEHVLKNKFQHLVAAISPALPEIIFIEQKVKWVHKAMQDSNFKEETIISAKINWDNKPLVSKLYQLGIMPFSAIKITDSLMKLKVKEAQRQFNLPADGELRITTLKELNVPLSARLQQLSFSLNYYRWLYCLTQKQSVITVNIPAAYMKVYSNNKVILEMRMIVGKQSTPTPTLASSVKEVILYPYWHVPFSIATKELLPVIKRNPGYINAGNYQVLNSSGKILDPYSINWHAFSTSYFPYIIRQSTGCDNALGLIKLNFYSPFGVYLHDTPNKSLFKQAKRFFSHGCMRMEKPMELGHLVLKDNPKAIDSLEQKGCVRNQSPIHVPADIKMKVVVWYNPAGIDSSGRVIFFEDVYKKFNWVK